MHWLGKRGFISRLLHYGESYDNLKKIFKDYFEKLGLVSVEIPNENQDWLIQMLKQEIKEYENLGPYWIEEAKGDDAWWNMNFMGLFEDSEEQDEC